MQLRRISDPGPNNDPGIHAVIWPYDTLDGTIHNLVDLKTPVPGGRTLVRRGGNQNRTFERERRVPG